MKERLKYLYEQKYKHLLIIPLALFVLAILQITVQYATTGDFINKGITLRGGSTITLQETTLDPLQLEQLLHQSFPTGDISVRIITSIQEVKTVAVESDAQQKEEINAIISVLKEKAGVKEGEYSVEVVGSSLGNSFFRQTMISLLIAFMFMSIVVFLYLRVPIPSLTVILCAFSDIIITLAIFNVTGMKLSSAGVAAFLMLVGYSVDTDILLSVRVLKRQEGTVMERVYSSVKTGMTMTFTTIVAVTIALFFVQSDVVQQIMIIILIGLFVDMIMTWIQNVAILRWYLERKEHKQ